MDYYTLFILGIGSYFISNFIDNKTKNIVLNYITSYNYTIKNGKHNVLNEYIHIYPICNILKYIPFINIIINGIEGIVTLNNIDGIFEELKSDGFLSMLSKDEIDAYNETENKEKIALEIMDLRENFSIKEKYIKGLTNNEEDLLILDKIKRSDIENINKIGLLKVLEYNINNNIKNINYNKLIDYAKFFLDFNYSNYYKIFNLNVPNYLYEKDSYNKILLEANKIINTDLKIEDKDQILESMVKMIIDEVRMNGRGRHNNIDVNIVLDEKKECTIKVKSKRKNISLYIFSFLLSFGI